MRIFLSVHDFHEYLHFTYVADITYAFRGGIGVRNIKKNATVP